MGCFVKELVGVLKHGLLVPLGKDFEYISGQLMDILSNGLTIFFVIGL